MKYDFVVIGAGIAGLTAALLLSRKGRRVALVEKGPVIAPLVRGFRRRGLQFDTGFHYAGGLGQGEIFDRLCRYLGLGEHLVRVPLATDGYDTVRCLRPDFEFRYPQGEEYLRDELHAAFPRERQAIDCYLQEIDQAIAGFPYLNPETPIAPQSVDGPTLQQVLDALTGDRLLQAVLSVHTMLYGVPPTEAPFALHAAVAGLYYRSAHTLQGGGSSLAAAFEAELQRQGVDLWCGQGAEAIVLEGSAVAGVRLAGGRTLTCSGCIATVHPRVLLQLVPEEAFRSVYRRRLQNLEETPSAFLLYGAGAGLPDRLRRGNCFLLPDPEAGSRLEEMNLQTGAFYVTGAHAVENNGHSDGFLAIFPGHAGMVADWSNSRSGRRSADYATFKAAMVQKMQDKMSLFFPGWQSGWAEGSTPLTLRDYANSPDGSLYGVKHRTGQFNPQSVTRVPGLLLAGQATTAPGVLGAMVSSFMACGESLGHEQLLGELRAC